jgi:hypothetical protein
MAKIIPDYCETTSQAEKKIFDLFRQSEQQTADWVVIHSQNIRNNPHPGSTPRPQDLLLFEADFIVIIPGKGIYLLEVKGGGIGCSNGSLTTTNGKGEVHFIDPVSQAKRCKHALIEYLEETVGKDISFNIVVDFAVVFPQSPTPLRKLPDLDETQIIDSHKLSSDGLVKSILAVAERYKGTTDFTNKIRDDIVRALRPSFDTVKLMGTQLKACESTINKLTAEQYERLDDISFNPGMMFIGAAGTGKTTLAQELFSRNCNNGRSTAFFCYNRLLGQKIEMNNRSALFIYKNSKVSSIHSAMNSWIKSSKFAKDLATAEETLGKESAKLYAEIYPDLALKAVEELTIQYDHLIIDEAQDIVTEPYVRVLDKIIKGGLKGGRWTFFGDFEQQAIFGATSLETARNLIGRFTGNIAPVGKLRTNCRNSAKIATETAKISGFDRAPTKNLNHEGTDVNLRFFSSQNEQAKWVAEEITKLKAAGISPSDIVILSNRRLTLSGANGADGTGAFQIIDVTQAKSAIVAGSQVGFATVQAFKGLEASAVIICDLEKVDDLEARSLIYVAMSRAKSHLSLFAHSKIRDQIIELRTKSLLSA